MHGKRWSWIALGLFVLVIAGGVLVTLRGEAWLRKALVTRGAEELGVSVALRGLSFSPFVGRAGIEGLTIGEPPGFGDAPALELGRAGLRLDPWAVFDDPVTIDGITVEGLHVRFIWRDGRSNLTALKQRLDELAARWESSDQAEEGPALRIRELLLADIRVTVTGELPDAIAGTIGARNRSGERTLTLADMTLTDIGGRDGVPASEALRLVLQALIPQIEKAARSQLADWAGRKLKKKVKNKALDKLRGLLEGKRRSPPAPSPAGPDDNGG